MFGAKRLECLNVPQSGRIGQLTEAIPKVEEKRWEKPPRQYSGHKKGRIW